MRRPTALLVAGLATLAVVSVTVASVQLSTDRPQATVAAAPAAPSASASAPANDRSDPPSVVVPAQASSAAVPTRVRVPRLGIDSGLDWLQIDAGGVLERPPRWQTAGWYAAGPRPGETGPAVIAGHVDSPSGPAVFARLAEVRAGDVVRVTGKDGRTVSFRVDRTQLAPKHAFPTRAVYGPTPDAQLRLVTCDGPYVDSSGGYQDNLIVFATEVPA